MRLREGCLNFATQAWPLQDIPPTPFSMTRRNEKHKAIGDCQIHSTTTATAPRYCLSDGLVRPRFRSHVPEISENSTAPASAFPQQISPQPDNECCFSSCYQLEPDEDITRSVKVAPKNWVSVASRIGSSRRRIAYSQGELHLIRRDVWQKLSPFVEAFHSESGYLSFQCHLPEIRV